MKKDQKNILKGAVVAAVVIYIVMAAVFGTVDPRLWKASVIPGPVTPSGAVGMFDMKTAGYNTLDMGASLAEATNYNLYWYVNRAGWMNIGKGATTIELTAQDAGYVWAVVVIPSGQSYYVDAASTHAKNARAQAVDFMDVTNNGYKYFMFKIDMTNIPKPASGNPGIYFYPYLLAYQKPTLNSPDAIGSIGTSPVSEYVQWSATFSTLAKSWAIVKVELSVNSTDTTKIQIQHVNVPSVGYLTGDQFGTPLKGTTTLTWDKTIGSNLQDAAYMEYSTNQLNKFDFTTQVLCTFTSGNEISVTLTVYGLTTTGALESITGTVVLSA